MPVVGAVFLVFGEGVEDGEEVTVSLKFDTATWLWGFRWGGRRFVGGRDVDVC